MRFRTIVLMLCVAVALGFGWTAAIQAQAQKTFVFFWTHDGVQTDSYLVTIDAGTPIMVPTTACTGVMPTRICTVEAPLTMNMQHTVLVQAVNIYGVVDADPFRPGPPNKPTGVGGRVK